MHARDRALPRFSFAVAGLPYYFPDRRWSERSAAATSRSSTVAPLLRFFSCRPPLMLPMHTLTPAGTARSANASAMPHMHGLHGMHASGANAACQTYDLTEIGKRVLIYPAGLINQCCSPWQPPPHHRPPCRHPVDCPIPHGGCWSSCGEGTTARIFLSPFTKENRGVPSHGRLSNFSGALCSIYIHLASRMAQARLLLS